jgi:predicted KAP-like P-loop ATPase
MFIPDRSISVAKDDKLNRAPFAYRLADTIRDWKQDESIVIGLYGPWGSGKTSVLNFAVERLHETTSDWPVEKRPIVIQFNPWNFSEQERLIRVFFQQIYAEISKIDKKAGENLKAKFKTFAQVLGALEPLPGVGAILGAGGKFVELFTTDQTLEDTKIAVSDIFQKLRRRIIIVIDDVDRLSRDEIRLLFQLIKINADFPNTIYLVAFDRAVVENALTTEPGVSGREYLEKIVQVGFNIPNPDPTLLQTIFFVELDKVLDDILVIPLEKERWAKLYYSGFNTFFQTVRDIKRFINSLGMNIRMAKTEIDEIDFIGLEGLRVFLPEIYEGIAENKNLFTQTREALAGHNPLLPQVKETLDSIFKIAEGQAEIAQKICVALFPALDSVYGNTYYSDESWLFWRKQKRICHKDNFDAYFLLGTPKGLVSHLEADEFLSKSTSDEAVIRQLVTFTTEGRLGKLLRRISDKLDNLGEDKIDILSRGLMNFGDSTPNIQEGIFEVSSDWQINSLVRSLMMKLPDEKRFNWFRTFLENKPPLYTVVGQVHFDSTREGNRREVNLFTEDQLEELKTICVHEIENRSLDNNLLRQKEFLYILSRWKEWCPESARRDAFLKSVLENIETGLDFLSGFLRDVRSQTAGNYFVEIEKQVDTKNLYEFQTPESVAKFINDITDEDEARLCEEQRAIIHSVKGALLQQGRAELA